jgi:4-carboxymuconolactone decarboxylase
MTRAPVNKTSAEFSSKTLEAGRAIRREVLGADYVDRKASTTGTFAKPFADLMTEYCWGAVWGRPGLSRRDRSLLNLGMLCALNRSDELAAHINGALNNGITPEEMREAFMQVGVYCGMPAAMGAFRIARQVFEESGLVFEEKPAP